MGNLVIISVFTICIFFFESSFLKAGDKVKFLGVKSVTIKGVIKGNMQNGTYTEYIDDYGNIRVEKSNVTMAGYKVNQWIIQKGRDIYTLDEKTKTATKTVNTMYDSMAASVKAKGREATYNEFYAALGGSLTGETGKYADQICDYWEIKNINSQVCVTEEGLGLSVKSNMGGMSINKEATEVKMGDPGPKSVYEIPAGYKIVKGMVSPGGPKSIEDLKDLDINKLMEDANNLN